MNESNDSKGLQYPPNHQIDDTPLARKGLQQQASG
jgi:hypothetical protein